MRGKFIAHQLEKKQLLVTQIIIIFIRTASVVAIQSSLF